MRNFEVQLRNRESQQSSEVLMSALAAMQDKNATLEKNLSAETRVKLDLFSALGETRRQLEIATCKRKIASLVKKGNFSIHLSRLQVHFVLRIRRF